MTLKTLLTTSPDEISGLPLTTLRVAARASLPQKTPARGARSSTR